MATIPSSVPVVSSVEPVNPFAYSAPYFLDFLPKEVWKHNVCSYLDLADLSNLRATSRWFHHAVVVAPVWKQWVPFMQLKPYLENLQRFHWEANVYGLYFAFFDYFAFSQTSFHFSAPASLQEIDLSCCTQLTDPDLNFLPQSLKKLTLPWMNQLTITKLENLLSNSINLYFRDMQSNSAGVLYWASSNDSFPLVSYCAMEPDIDLDEPNSLGMTALFIAAQKRYIPIAELLLDKGADPDKASNSGYTPLMIATEWGHTEMVALLLKYKPDLKQKDLAGRTALDIAQSKNLQQIVPLLHSQATN